MNYSLKREEPKGNESANIEEAAYDFFLSKRIYNLRNPSYNSIRKTKYENNGYARSSIYEIFADSIYIFYTL